MCFARLQKGILYYKLIQKGDYDMTALSLTESEELKIKQIKNHIHQYPELSWEEYETTAYIRNVLATLDGIEFLDDILGNGIKEGQTSATGVVAMLKGTTPGKTIALRADIDALAANEETDVELKSRIPGKAHTCGHDFHTAALLGTAMILSRIRKELVGNVIFIFQPAEETTDGAGKMIEAGLFEKTSIDMLFGFHNRPEIETGKVVVKNGPLMASKDKFKITLHGVSAHGSMPHKGTDPIVCAASMIQALQTVSSRNTDPFEPIALSIGSIHGGVQENLIPNELEMTGSIRIFDPTSHTRAIERVETIVKMIAESYECGWNLEWQESLPALINPEPMYQTAKRAVTTALGEDAIVDSQPTLATEDFSLFMQKVPAFFYWIGNRKSGDTCYSWHNTKFHADNDALKIASAVMAQSVIEANR